MALQSAERKRGYKGTRANGRAVRPFKLPTLIQETPAPVLSVGDFVGTWELAIVTPRCEKKVARQLGLLDISCYLPIRHEVRKYAKWQTTLDLPLFPMYLPVCWLTHAERVRIFDAPHIMRMQRIVDQDKFRGELANVEAALSVDSFLGLETKWVRVGVRCRVKRGPFMNIEGELAEIRGQQRVVVSIEFMDGVIPLDVAITDIEPI